MPILVDEMRLLYSLPFARSLRELARLAGVSPNTAVKFYNQWSLRGSFIMVPDDAYFGFARVVYIAEKASWPGSLPYGSLEVMTLSSPRGEHTLVHGLVPRVLVEDYVRDLAATLGEGGALVAQEVQHWVPISKLQGLRPVDAERLPKLVDSLLPELKRAEPLDMPDVWDLVYLTGKMMLGPFARPSYLLRRLQPLFWLPIPAQTTRSYHYKLHFLPGWLYTTFRERRRPQEAVKVALELEGKDAARVAKALALLPAWGVSFIADRRAVYVGQVDAAFLPSVYDILHGWRAEAVRGLLFAKSHLELDKPLLWRFLSDDGKAWVMVEERARVPSYVPEE